MKKLFLFLCSLLLSHTMFSQSIRLAPFVTADMLHEDFWLSRAENPTRVRMTLREIDDWNQDVKKEVFYKTKFFEYHHLYDLRAQPERNKEALLYSLAAIYPYNWFLRVSDGYEKPEDFLDITENMRLEALWNSADEVVARKAVCVRRADMRNMPDDNFYTNTFADLIEDVNQASALLMNEPVLVLHESADGRWYFIQSEYCFGWIHKDAIAFCTDAEFDDFFDFPRKSADTFLTITVDYARLRPLSLSHGAGTPLEVELFMGTHLFTLDWSDEVLLDAFNGRIPYASYAAKIPYRKDDGFLGWCYASVPLTLCCAGLLPFTLQNELHLIFQCMGNEYGWAGMAKQRDCSSLMQDIFKCFGFTFPRNSRFQAAMPGKTIQFPEFTDKTDEVADANVRHTLMASVQAGAILCIPGHVMLYLGEVDGRYYVVSALGFYYEPTEKDALVVGAFSVNVNTLDELRKNNRTWLQNITAAKF